MNIKSKMVLIILMCLLNTSFFVCSEKERVIINKDPWSASIYSLMIPTAGHFYANDWKRGWPYAGIELSAGILLSPYSFYSPFIIAGARLYSSYDSYRAVQDYNARLLDNKAQVQKNVDAEPKPVILSPLDLVNAQLEYFEKEKDPERAKALGVTLGHRYAGDWARGLKYLPGYLPLILLTVVATVERFEGNTIGAGGIAIICFLPLAMITKYFEGKDAYKAAEEYNNNLKKQLGLSFDWQYKHAFSLGVSYNLDH